MIQTVPSLPDPDFRQVLVVRHDLNMRRGKLAAQAAHASMASLLRAPGAQLRAMPDGSHELAVPLDVDTYAWLTGRFKKVCVSVKNEAELLDIQAKAVAAGLRVQLIQDAGLTEFGGVPTHTFLAIGPHAKTRLDPVTGHLPLY